MSEPEEIALKIVEKWWPLSATVMGDIRLRDAIAPSVKISEAAE